LTDIGARPSEFLFELTAIRCEACRAGLVACLSGKEKAFEDWAQSKEARVAGTAQVLIPPLAC
jgi:hypothetical protein